MTDFKDLDKFELAALKLLKSWEEPSYSDEEYYKYRINDYDCEQERKRFNKEADKFRILVQRIEMAKEVGLI